MNDWWFALYHAYTISRKYDIKALKIFEEDVAFAQEIGIRGIILEDYYKNFNWGEYTSFWSEKNFKIMIKIAHNYDIKLIPYFNPTELSIKSDSYKLFGKEWGAKNWWGNIYSGFNSIFLPIIYPNPKYMFFNKIMCPKSGWKDHLLGQAESLINNFEIDGIYFDRVDYRVNCLDHVKDKEHFRKGIPNLVKSVVKIIKENSRSNFTIVNDSGMRPDDILIECINSVDMVLSELLPVDWNPYSLYNKLNLEFGDIAWKLRKILHPLTRIITEMKFTSSAMVNLKRLLAIVNRLKQHKTPENIMLFSHRKDEKGLKALQEVSTTSGCKLSYFMGLKRLIHLNNWNIFD